jgi:hypothetical protein
MKSVSVLLELQYNPQLRHVFSLVERKRLQVASVIEHSGGLCPCTVYLKNTLIC